MHKTNNILSILCFVFPLLIEPDRSNGKTTNKKERNDLSHSTLINVKVMKLIDFVVGNASTTGSMTSEFVRQELRAIVGARTQQQQQQQRVPNSIPNNLSGQVSQDDLEALGLTFEMSTAGINVNNKFSYRDFVTCRFDFTFVGWYDLNRFQ